MLFPRFRSFFGGETTRLHIWQPPPLCAWAGLALFTAIAACPLRAQEPKVFVRPENSLRGRTAAPRANMRLDMTMVLVPVTVTDVHDKPVTDLSLDSFKIFEDNVEQKIANVSQEDGPVSVGFIFDASSSMKNRMQASIKAIEQFLKTMIPGDEFFLVQFNDKPQLVNGFTTIPDDILSGLSFVQPQGWTALHDAICLGLHQMKSAKNSRRALLVLTDGGDNNSRYSESEVQSMVRESDVRVYSIGLFERPHFLEKLAADSGGHAFWTHKLSDLPQTIDHLSREFRNQYVLAYSSNNARNDGKYRKVRVELMESIRRIPLNLIWRRGYYAPPD